MRLGLVTIGLAACACATWRADLAPARDTVACGCTAERAAADAVEITYLGSGGLLIRRGEAALLTAPFFSNPGLARVGLGLPIRSDPSRVARGLARVGRHLGRVEAILVGHAHYDHLMDVPATVAEIARRRGDTARDRPTIYASRTAAHVLAAFSPLAARVEAVNARAGTWRRPGRWLPEPAEGGSPAFRFMPLHSEHEPHFLGIRLFAGRLRRDRDRPPCNAWGWVEGETLAWLIDVRGADGGFDFRIHYQDASSSPPWGFPPPLPAPDDLPTDVAILSVSGFERVAHYPDAILRDLRPGHAVLAHWEDFFHDPERPVRPVPGLDTGELVARVESALPEGAGWTAPEPGTTLRFCAGAAGGWRPLGSDGERACVGASGPSVAPARRSPSGGR
jgi:hypothetical protein